MKCKICGAELNKNIDEFDSSLMKICDDCWKNLDCQCGLDKL